jgi:hypothetical protein
VASELSCSRDHRPDAELTQQTTPPIARRWPRRDRLADRINLGATCEDVDHDRRPTTTPTIIIITVIFSTY